MSSEYSIHQRESYIPLSNAIWIEQMCVTIKRYEAEWKWLWKANRPEESCFRLRGHKHGRDPETGAASSRASFNAIAIFLLPSYSSLTHVELFFIQVIKTRLLIYKYFSAIYVCVPKYVIFLFSKISFHLLCLISSSHLEGTRTCLAQ